MLKIRSSLLLSALLLAGAIAGCKKDPDEGLVLFDVSIADGLSFASIDFSVDMPKGIPTRRVRINELPNKRMFRFGYYMPSVNAANPLVIVATAYDDNLCQVGTGSLPNVPVPSTGKVTMVTDHPLMVGAMRGPCMTDAGAGHGGMAGQGGSNGDASPDVSSGNAGSGGGSDGGTEPDSSVVVTGKQANGMACGMPGDCISGYCVDGVCCNETCTGLQGLLGDVHGRRGRDLRQRDGRGQLARRLHRRDHDQTLWSRRHLRRCRHRARRLGPVNLAAKAPARMPTPSRELANATVSACA